MNLEGTAPAFNMKPLGAQLAIYQQYDMDTWLHQAIVQVFGEPERNFYRLEYRRIARHTLSPTETRPYAEFIATRRKDQ